MWNQSIIDDAPFVHKNRKCHAVYAYSRGVTCLSERMTNDESATHVGYVNREGRHAVWNLVKWRLAVFVFT